MAKSAKKTVFWKRILKMIEDSRKRRKAKDLKTAFSNFNKFQDERLEIGLSIMSRVLNMLDSMEKKNEKLGANSSTFMPRAR